MSDWVNWQEYATLNEPEVQRMAKEAESRAGQEQARMNAALGNLTSEARRRAGEGNFLGAESLGGYGEVMRQRDMAQAQQQRVPGALERPSWEADLTRGKSNEVESPWAQLGARLAAGTNKAMEVNTRSRQAQQQAAQAAEQKRFNDEARAKAGLASNGKRESEAAQYTKWSDAVNNSAANSGGYGAGAWHDWQQGYGPGPATTAPSTPRTKRTQGYAYGASPTNSNSNFGLNSGYSSGNDWNF